MTSDRKKDYVFRFVIVPLFLVGSPMVILAGMIADKIDGIDNVVKKNINEAPGVFKEAYQYIRYGKLK